MGFCGCSVGPMGLIYEPYGNLWGAVAAVPTLWGICGQVWLRCRPHGASLGCCGCGMGLMGLIHGPYENLLVAVAAVSTLWGLYGPLWLRCGTMGICCDAVAAVPALWGESMGLSVQDQ